MSKPNPRKRNRQPDGSNKRQRVQPPLPPVPKPRQPPLPPVPQKVAAARKTLSAHVGAILDPFNNTPHFLGSGGSANVAKVSSGVVEFSYQLTADGSGCICLNPAAFSSNTISNRAAAFLSLATSGYTAAYVGTAAAMQNAATIGNNSLRQRVVAASLKVTPLLAATAAPGVIFAGQTNALQASTSTTQQVGLLDNMSSSFCTPGKSYTRSWAPSDQTDSQFEILGGSTGNNSSDAIIIGFYSFPASTVFHCQYVVHFEVQNASSSASPFPTAPPLDHSNSVLHAADAVGKSHDAIISDVSQLLGGGLTAVQSMSNLTKNASAWFKTLF